MAKTQTVQKSTYMWHSGSKSQQAGQESAASVQRRSFCYFFILSYFLVQKYCQQNRFSK